MAAITTTGSGNWSSTVADTPWPSGTVPGDGDTVTIANGHTVTLDQNLTIGADTTTAAIAIASGGKLQYLAAAAAAYTLTSKGDISVTGTLEFGTTGSPIGATRGVTIIFDSATAVDGEFGLLANNGSTVTIQGDSKTVADTLAADAAANATSLTTTTSTGWKDNDEIVIASTTRTATQTEKGALNGNATGTGLTVDGFAGTGGGVANAHSGTSPTKAEVINLTRNMKIRGESDGMAYFSIATTATVDVDYVEFRYLGENATTKRGIEIATTSGSASINGCSLYDCEDYGTYIIGATSNNITYTNNVHYNLDNTSGNQSFRMEATSNSSITISGNYWLGCLCSNNTRVIYMQDGGGTFTNNVVAGSGTGTDSRAIETDISDVFGTWSGITCHSNTGMGFRQQSGAGNGTVSNLTLWRNGSRGLDLENSSYGMTFDTATIFGNASNNMQAGGSGQFYICKNFTLNSEASFTTGNGLFIGGSGKIFFIDSSFGATTAHTSNDVFIQNNHIMQVCFINSTAASATQASIQTGGHNVHTFVSFARNGATTAHKVYYSFGTVTADTTTRHTASGFSWQMKPNSAAQKLVLPGPTKMDTFKVAVNSGAAVTISAWVQKDGSYNGNAPRLVIVGGVTQGIASDVTDSLTVGASTWEELSVSATPTETGTVEYYVDCDGTAGNVYVDDITKTQA